MKLQQEIDNLWGISVTGDSAGIIRQKSVKLRSMDTNLKLMMRLIQKINVERSLMGFLGQIEILFLGLTNWFYECYTINIRRN